MTTIRSSHGNRRMPASNTAIQPSLPLSDKMDEIIDTCVFNPINVIDNKMTCKIEIDFSFVIRSLFVTSILSSVGKKAVYYTKKCYESLFFNVPLKCCPLHSAYRKAKFNRYF